MLNRRELIKLAMVGAAKAYIGFPAIAAVKTTKEICKTVIKKLSMSERAMKDLAEWHAEQVENDIIESLSGFQLFQLRSKK